MKILIIDSHKGSLKEPQNLHWLNAKQIKDHLISLGHDVDLIWSYPSVNDNIKSGCDKIIASRASYGWLQKQVAAIRLSLITAQTSQKSLRNMWTNGTLLI